VKRLHHTLEVIRRLGWRWLFFRAGYELRVRTGLMCWQSPAFTWADRPLARYLRPGVPTAPEAYAQWRRSHSPRFFFQKLPTAPDAATQALVKTEADALLEGHWVYFSALKLKHPFPPDWHRHPLNGRAYAPDQHWSQIDDFEQGDIKFVWEPARFACAFLFARAYAYTGDERYPQGFWALVMDWREHNPPRLGVHWKSGQELAIRLLGWVWGLYAFAGSPHTTPARTAALVQMIAVQAAHIDQHHAFARSQKNNHAILEGVALLTVGLLFPEFAQAQHWRSRGKAILEREVMRQVYPDGGYMQHSPNYERLMLDSCLWALQLGQLQGLTFAPQVITRLKRAAQFLQSLMEPTTGQLPNLGHNDGALLLPLTRCDYSDYRPTLEWAHVIFEGTRRFAPSPDQTQPQPWLEGLYWLLESDLPSWTPLPPQADLTAPQSGCYTLQGEHSWALIRCAQYQDRPAHADQLHLDLWWQGQNILMDAGTYRYNDDPPWDNALARTAAHNTVLVDDCDQMLRAGRFLWLEWARGWVRHQGRRDAFVYWEGEHDGYWRLSAPVRHRRAVLLLRGDLWLVVDHLSSSAEHHYRLNWLVNPHHTVPILSRAFAGKAGYDLTLAQEDDLTTGAGWFSRYYGIRERAPKRSLVLRAKDAVFCTLIGVGAFTLQGSRLLLSGPQINAQITLDFDPHGVLMTHIDLEPTRPYTQED